MQPRWSIQAHCTNNMSKKKAFVLRVDPDKMEVLEKWAADEFRSTNGQLEWIIDQALRQSGRWKIKDDEARSGKSRNDAPDTAT